MMRTWLICLLLALLSGGPFSVGTAHASPVDDLGAADSAWTSAGRLPLLKVHHKNKKKQRALPLKHTEVQAWIQGEAARVEVRQTFINPFKRPIEAIYTFPLPQDAAVFEMQLKAGAMRLSADIKTREKARATYELAQAEGYAAALLEQERPNIFTQSVANLPPGQAVEITVSYLQPLTHDGGLYEFVFPMVVGPRFNPGPPTGRRGDGVHPDTTVVPDASRISPPRLGRDVHRGHRISLNVELNPALPVVALDTPSHPVEVQSFDDDRMHIALAEGQDRPDRDFVMRWRVGGEVPRTAVQATPDGRGGGWLTLTVQPPMLDADAEIGRREVIFVVDVSGSMSGAPLGLAKALIHQLVRHLRPSDTFNIMTFAGYTAEAFERSRPALGVHIERAMTFIDGARAGGGTHLARAVETALTAPAADDRHRYVIFLTDGYVGDETRIFSRAERLVAAYQKRDHRARVFAVGCGHSVNHHLIDGLARAGEGLSLSVLPSEPVEPPVNRLFAALDRPVLTDLQVDWGDLEVFDLTPHPLPDLFATRPLILRGRYMGRAGPHPITVRGEANGRPMSLAVEAHIPPPEFANEPAMSVPRLMWARRRIEAFSRKLWAGYDLEAEQAITRLGLDHHLVTRFTSLVVVDRSRVVGTGQRRVVQPVHTPHGVSEGITGRGRGSHGGRGYGRSASQGMTGGVRAQVRYPMNLSAAAPGVRGSAPMVMGSLDRNQVTSVIRRSTQQMRRAYERQLKANPAVAQGGRVVMQVIINAEGRVQQARVVQSSMSDGGAVEADLVKVFKAMRFPAPAGGGQITLTYPVVFAPTDAATKEPTKKSPEKPTEKATNKPTDKPTAQAEQQEPSKDPEPGVITLSTEDQQPALTITASKLEGPGTLSPKAVREVMARELAGVQKRLREDLKGADFNALRGRVVLKVMVNHYGYIPVIHTVESTFKNKRVERSLNLQIRRWVFAHPDGGQMALKMVVEVGPRR